MHSESVTWISKDFRSGWVSVIIPTFNRKDLLVEAMDSVYKQSYRPVELIVVDDGSTDNTKEVVTRWKDNLIASDNDFLFKYLIQENKGAPAARNKGAIASSGEYIQFLDSDDTLHPENLDRIVSKFKETSCDYVITGFERFCTHCKKTILRHIPCTSNDPLLLLCKNELWANGIQYGWKRHIVNEIGPWDTKLDVYQDYDFIIRALLLSRKGEFIKESLAYSRFGAAGPRIFDIRQTRKAYLSFLRTNKKLCEGLQTMDIPHSAKKKLILKFYRKAVAVYLEYPHLGRRIGQLAYSISGSAFTLPRMIQWIFRLPGKKAVGVYLNILYTKYRLSGYLKKEKIPDTHNCRQIQESV